MNDQYMECQEKVIEHLSRFNVFVNKMDGRKGPLSFRDGSGFLGREEDYKSQIAEDARKELNVSAWNESWIGTDRIAECARLAMGKCGNLVNKNQQIDFKNHLNRNHPKYCDKAEQVLYDIYKNPHCDEKTAFTNAIEIFGAKYDTLAFLFFIKDDSRFLPVSTGHFDKGFAALGIKHTMSFQCCWENYQKFLNIIHEIRALMERLLPMHGIPRLIDAHSFVWIIQEDAFVKWMPNPTESVEIEQTTEEAIQILISGAGGYRQVTSKMFVRSSQVVKETRIRAKGMCQLCNQPAPFLDKEGSPYLEVHHVQWLSRGGKDDTENTVALCPNCHKRMHILDKKEDVMKLTKLVGAGT